MIDTSMYGRGGGFDSGLRMGQAIGGIFTGARDSGLREQALQRIQQGEDYNAVVQEVMQQSPQVAQELLNLRQQNMQAQAQQQNMQRTDQLIKIGDMELSKAKLQQSSMPMFGAMMTDNIDARKKLLEEAAAPFRESNPEVANTIMEIANQPPEVQVNAIGGIVKVMRQAGVYPDDPSQLGGGTALSQNLALLDQATAAGDTERAELIRRNIDPSARAMSQAEADLQRQQALNPVLAQREAAKAGALEQTAGGKVELSKAELDLESARQKAQKEQDLKKQQLDLSRQTMMLAREIANAPNLENVTGIAAMTPTINPESQDLILKAEQLISLLTADNLKLMSGVLTDKDIQMLQTLSSGMRVTDKGIRGSAPAIRKRLAEIAQNIEKKLGESAAETQPQPASTSRTEADIFAEYGL